MFGEILTQPDGSTAQPAAGSLSVLVFKWTRAVSPSYIYLKCLEEGGPVGESDTVSLAGCVFWVNFLPFPGLDFYCFTQLL